MVSKSVRNINVSNVSKSVRNINVSNGQ